jgi:hypothetical protein
LAAKDAEISDLQFQLAELREHSCRFRSDKVASYLSDDRNVFDGPPSPDAQSTADSVVSRLPHPLSPCFLWSSPSTRVSWRLSRSSATVLPLVLRPDEATGRGAYLADGVTLPQRTPIGFYFGEIMSGDSLDEFSLAMPVVRRERAALHLTVDAGQACRGARAHPLNMAMYAHSCREPTVRPSWFVELDLPCAVAYAPAGLPARSPLRWNYDGHGPGPGYTLSRREMLDFIASGGRAVPCACRQTLPCPRDRWLRVFD